jgi:hypothetical protein
VRSSPPAPSEHDHCPEHRNGDRDEQPCGDAEQSGNARKIICVCGDGEEAKGYAVRNEKLTR